jgi:hypothetical protein
MHNLISHVVTAAIAIALGDFLVWSLVQRMSAPWTTFRHRSAFSAATRHKDKTSGLGCN